MLGPVLRKKVVPEKWFTLPTESTLANPYMRKKGDPFLRANNARAHALIVQNGASACCDCLALTKLTRLGETVFLWRKFGPARRMTPSSKKGDPTSAARLDPSSRANFCLSWYCLPRFMRRCRKVVSSGRQAPLLPKTRIFRNTQDLGILRSSLNVLSIKRPIYNINPRTYKGAGGECHRPIRFFSAFSQRIKHQHPTFSVTVRSFLAQILRQV